MEKWAAAGINLKREEENILFRNTRTKKPIRLQGHCLVLRLDGIASAIAS